MANIFSENPNKQIPQTFEDCYKPDKLTKILFSWANRIEKWGSILLILIIILGIINTITTGVTAYNEADALGSRKDATLAAFLAILVSLFTYALYILIEYCFFKAISLLINALASIVKNTRITANLALYEYSKKYAEEVIETKPKSQNIKKDNEEILDNTIIVNCPHCNKLLELNEDVIKPYCPNCKKYFDI